MAPQIIFRTSVRIPGRGVATRWHCRARTRLVNAPASAAYKGKSRNPDWVNLLSLLVSLFQSCELQSLKGLPITRVALQGLPILPLRILIMAPSPAGFSELNVALYLRFGASGSAHWLCRFVSFPNRRKIFSDCAGGRFGRVNL
jgi:hypothetical protein